MVDVGVRDTELNVWTRNPHLDSRLELTSKKKKKRSNGKIKNFITLKKERYSSAAFSHSSDVSLLLRA